MKYPNIVNNTHSNSIKPIVFRLVAIAMVIGYEVAIAFSLGSNARLWDFTIFYIIDLSFFFVLAFYILPLSQKGILQTFFMISIILMGLLAHFIMYINGNDIINMIYDDRKPIEFGKYDYIRNLGRGIYILGAAIFYYVAHLNIANSRRVRDSEIRRIILENEYLRTQVNPHFLFNTLNMIISSAEDSPERTMEMMMLLSSMMRDTLTEVNADGKIPLSLEIKQIERLLKLNKLRLKDNMCINASINVREDNQLRIPPLLLISLVENMFKYGKLNDRERPATLNIDLKDNILLFHLANVKKKYLDLEGMAVGMSNAKARLKNHYGNGHELRITDNNELFALNLKLAL